MITLQFFLEAVIVLLTVSGPAYYIWQTLHGTVVPHRLTFFFWFLVQAIAVTASLSQGVTLVSQLTVIISTISCLLTFISSFYQRDGTVWKFSRFDWACAALAIFGIILWQITKVPNLAIVFAIIADIVITLPTLVKSYHAPETESAISYAPFLIAHIINIAFLTKVYNFPTLAMPVYLVFNVIFIITIILLGRYKRRKLILSSK